MNNLDIIIIMARTGAGKTTVEKVLKERMTRLGIKTWKLKTATTRKKRINEGDNEYIFMSDEDFDKRNFLSKFVAPNGKWIKTGVLDNFSKKNGIGFFSVISQDYALDTLNAFEKKGKKVKLIILDFSREVRLNRLLSRNESKVAIKKRFSVEDLEGEYDLSKIPKDSIIIYDEDMSPEEIVEYILEKI